VQDLHELKIFSQKKAKRKALLMQSLKAKIYE